jgi:hypothetical protein
MEYVAVLKHLMSTCQYPAIEYDNQLRDRLLHGCNDSRMQLEMIKVGNDMTLDTALQAALQFEATQKSVKDVEQTRSP